MNDSLSRLLWALPLVLLLGVAAIFIVKRSLDRLGLGRDAELPMRLRQSLALSEGLNAHLMDVDGQPVLVLEGASAAGTQVQLLARPAPARGWPGVARRGTP